MLTEFIPSVINEGNILEHHTRVDLTRGGHLCNQIGGRETCRCRATFRNLALHGPNATDTIPNPQQM